MANFLGGLRDGKDVVAFSAGRRRTICRASVQIKIVLAMGTATLLIVDICGENSSAFRADYADFWLAVGIGVSDEDVSRK